MFQSLIDVILPVFLVIGAGYVATRRGYFQASHVDGLMKFTQSFAIPCLLFRAIATLDLSASFDPRLLISFYTGAAIGFCCLFSNSVLLGLPITERAYGADNLTGNYAIIAFHSPFCYGLGITVMEIVRNKGAGGFATVRSVFSAMFKNVLILGIALGFVVNLSGLWIPQAVDEALSLVIRAALPTALFALGGVLVQYRPEGDLRAIGFVCAISLMVHPALVWSMGSALKVQPDLFRSAVLNAAMAPGFNAYIFANMYGRAKRVAASSVLIATGSCILTVWLWLLILG
ncbi:AEC family transporter [Phaeobacter inhibens]|uniref:AEC family transporter n=1 Tax=Phaeobacter inhibens TaxID=221822 RepID=UPI0021A6072F|nr:AEC family transporter [Phaeobacter inhibens]UWS01007.1 AEC family transporter [Phaeobacter inhibens]